jgi:hypothetical protein
MAEQSERAARLLVRVHCTTRRSRCVPKMLLAEPPPRDSHFGSPLKLSRVHWVRPEVVMEVDALRGLAQATVFTARAK